MDSAIHKYLRHHTEPEIAALAGFPAQRWEQVLLVPAYRESPNFVARLDQALLRQQPTLLILVINQPDTVTAPDPANRELAGWLADHYRESWHRANLTLLTSRDHDSAILVADRYSCLTIPRKQGVGLARKIAADLALSLMVCGHITSPWMNCADADTHLPEDYFSPLGALPENCAAVTYPFRHRCGDDALGRATKLYEQHLHHYVSGLKRAGSPYAFHTIGSIIAIHRDHYARVRGFPKRAGGEDFYLLNKLAKSGSVIPLDRPLVTIDARMSDRVPFGTGPAVEKLMAGQPALTYSPLVFDALKEWLDALPLLWANHGALDSLPAPTSDTLAVLGVQAAIDHSRCHSGNQATFERHMHGWFDGFRTMKFIHQLQDVCYHPVTIDTFRECQPGQ